MVSMSHSHADSLSITMNENDAWECEASGGCALRFVTALYYEGFHNKSLSIVKIILILFKKVLTYIKS